MSTLFNKAAKAAEPQPGPKHVELEGVVRVMSGKTKGLVKFVTLLEDGRRVTFRREGMGRRGTNGYHDPRGTIVKLNEAPKPEPIAPMNNQEVRAVIQALNGDATNEHYESAVKKLMAVIEEEQKALAELFK